MPASPVSSSTRRPTRSTSQMATIVSNTFTTPMPAVARIAADAEDKPDAWKMTGAK